ncbi:hypothetical protein NHX12_029878 [Muraenolepis orangiensis]|uniref:Transposase n=1 Tax=Muraenolepis orangiensis TaxID=630683 RepID=A0A9Q0E729_9TELE|nr:hypothetical protein NHX12_029878 [Muraenolepis orangiensis]
MPPKPVKPTPGPSQASNLTANAGNAVDENLLKAIRNIVQSVIHEENNALREEIRRAVSPLKAALETCEGTLQEHEEGLNCLDSRLEAMEKQYDQLYDNYKILQAKTDDLENRGRRCNIRILHVKEGLESGNPTKCVANLLTEILGGPGGLQSPPTLDRAHRTGPANGGRPRSFLARFHYFQEKEQVLRLAREKGRLEFQGGQVMIFPDFSAGLSKRRAEFIEVKKLLRGKEVVRYGLVYPARLRVSFQGEENMFDTPQAVKDFIANKM